MAVGEKTPESAVLSQYRRRRIFYAVREHGEATYSYLKRVLGCEKGVLQYHLQMLVKKGFLIREDGQPGCSRPYRVSKNFSDYKPEAG